MFQPHNLLISICFLFQTNSCGLKPIASHMGEEKHCRNFNINLKMENCPETLVFSLVQQRCVIECIPPIFTTAETNSLLVLQTVLGYIGFGVNYFYCFTAILRPSMRRYPNSNSFNIALFGGLSCLSAIWTSLLGYRYVYCDDNISTATIKNWACVVECKLLEMQRKLYFPSLMFYLLLQLYLAFCADGYFFHGSCFSTSALHFVCVNSDIGIGGGSIIYSGLSPSSGTLLFMW